MGTGEQLRDMLKTIDDTEQYLRRRCRLGTAGQSLLLFEDLSSLIALIHSKFFGEGIMPEITPSFRSSDTSQTAMMFLNDVALWKEEVREKIHQKEIRAELARGNLLDAIAKEGGPFAAQAKEIVRAAKTAKYVAPQSASGRAAAAAAYGKTTALPEEMGLMEDAVYERDTPPVIYDGPVRSAGAVSASPPLSRVRPVSAPPQTAETADSGEEVEFEPASFPVMRRRPQSQPEKRTPPAPENNKPAGRELAKKMFAAALEASPAGRAIRGEEDAPALPEETVESTPRRRSRTIRETDLPTRPRRSAPSPQARPMPVSPTEEEPPSVRETRAKPMRPAAEEEGARSRPMRPAAGEEGARARPMRPAPEEEGAMARPMRPAAEEEPTASLTPPSTEENRPSPKDTPAPSRGEKPSRSSGLHIIHNAIDTAFYGILDEAAQKDEDALFSRLRALFGKLEARYKSGVADYARRLPFWGAFDPEAGQFELFRNRAAQFCAHGEDFAALYERLGDFRSKKTLFAILDNWYSFNFKELVNVREKAFPMYFDCDILQCGRNEVYVDLGSYTGETLSAYAETFGSFRTAYCYEITEQSFSALQKCAADFQNVVLRNVGVSSKAGRGFLHAGREPAFNTVGEAGSLPVDLVRLDEDIREPVGVMKVCLCGGEIPALRGAAGLLKKDHPKLCVRADFSCSALWELFRTINEADKRYRFFLRHYGNNLVPSEYVLYAV